jgi:hypothetical protein
VNSTLTEDNVSKTTDKEIVNSISVFKSKYDLNKKEMILFLGLILFKVRGTK